MKQLVFLLLVCGACGGSDHSPADGGNDGSKQVPDGFVSTRCNVDADCVGDPCDTVSCDATTHACVLAAKTCAEDPSCTLHDTTCAVSVCNGGLWTQMPTSEGSECTTGDGIDGTCKAGVCTPPPSCFSSSTFSGSPARCGNGNGSDTLANNQPGGLGNAVVGSYACAPSEPGPEVAFPLAFDPALSADIDVTVSIKLTDYNGVPLADQTGVDLDLIVLQSSCTSEATCMNPLVGAGYAGVTVGTSDERVSFHADHTKTYYAVIDSSALSQAGTFVLTVESCGRCQATNSTRLDCNMTMPVTASTSTGMSTLTSYMCGATGSKTPVTLAGNELPFLLRDDVGVPRTISASIDTAANPATLLALDESQYGDCREADCITSSASTSGAASISFVTYPVQQSTLTPVYERFWLVVDTVGTVNAGFGLSVSCEQVCVAHPTTSYLACGGTTRPEQTTFSGTTKGGPAQYTQYGGAAPCSSLTGLTGPESIVTFAPQITGTKRYQLELASKTTGEELSFVVIDAGTAVTPTCDPTSACASAIAIMATTGNGFSGSFTTMSGKSAAATLSASAGHTYYVIVDGTDTAGADYQLTASGIDTGAGCGM